MFTLLIAVEVRPELLAEFARAIEENARVSVDQEPGCLRFDVYQETDTPTRWVLHEVYTEERAWATHRLSAHFLAYQAVADRALVSRTVTRLTPIVASPAS